MTGLPSALAILSAMLTPALLVLASASLISSTTARLISTISRTRETSATFTESCSTDSEGQLCSEERQLLLRQISRTTRRSRLLQRAMTDLHIAAGFFVATSVSIGVIETAGLTSAWVPIILGLLGAGTLLYAIILLIIDVHIGQTAVNDEMDFITRSTVGRDTHH